MTGGTSHDLLAVDPEEVSANEIDVDDVRIGLTAEKNLTRTRAARLATVLASEDVVRAQNLLSSLLDRLVIDDEHPVILNETLTALLPIAEQSPTAFDGDVGALVALLRHNLPVVRALTARVIRPIAVEHPDWFVPHVEDLIVVLGTKDHDQMQVLDSSQHPITSSEQHRLVYQDEQPRQVLARAVGANLLVAVADTDSDALVSALPTLVDLLDSDDPVVVAATVDAIATIAENHPRAANDAFEALCACLDSPEETVIARTIRALGLIGDDRAVDPLQKIATTETADENAQTSDDLRALAAETADWLDSNTN